MSLINNSAHTLEDVEKLYKELSKRFSIDIIASGGVSTMDDIIALKKLDLYGAIIGKAYYTKAIDLSQAIKETK